VWRGERAKGFSEISDGDITLGVRVIDGRVRRKGSEYNGGGQEKVAGPYYGTTQPLGHSVGSANRSRFPSLSSAFAESVRP